MSRWQAFDATERVGVCSVQGREAITWRAAPLMSSSHHSGCASGAPHAPALCHSSHDPLSTQIHATSCIASVGWWRLHAGQTEARTLTRRATMPIASPCEHTPPAASLARPGPPTSPFCLKSFFCPKKNFVFGPFKFPKQVIPSSRVLGEHVSPTVGQCPGS